VELWEVLWGTPASDVGSVEVGEKEDEDEDEVGDEETRGCEGLMRSEKRGENEGLHIHNIHQSRQTGRH